MSDPNFFSREWDDSTRYDYFMKNPEIAKAIRGATKHVTADAYFGAKNPSPDTYSAPVRPNPSEQAMPANPTVKSSLDPGTSASTESTLKTAQMFLGVGNAELAITYFNQVLENEPNNALALEGLEKARGKS